MEASTKSTVSCLLPAPEQVKAQDLFLGGVDGLVAGHCGLPFTQTIDGRLWHNPGVIGMPANDGTRGCGSAF